MSDLTADQLEAIFHAALKAGDAQSTVDALKLMVTVDPSRCERLHSALTAALEVAHAVNSGDAGAHDSTSGEVGQ